VSTNVKHLDNATNEITKELTQFNTVLCQKLDGPQILQKFLAFYGSCKFTTAFTRAPPFVPILSNIISVRAKSYLLKINFNIILPTTLRSSKLFLFASFPHHT